MKETFNCPCKKEEEIVLIRLYNEYDQNIQYFLRLSPQAKELLKFLEDKEALGLNVEWDFDIESITKEF